MKSMSSGKTVSLWMATHDVPAFKALDTDLETDTVIVGAGIAGLTTAYVLAKKGVKVVVLEKGEILRGETERTTAHLAYALDDRWFEIQRVHGEEHAKLAAESHSRAIDFIEETVKKEKIDCDFLRVDGYLFPGEGEDPREIDDELEAAHAVGLKDVKKLDKPPLPGLSGPCLHFPNQGQFHPTKYLTALAKAAEKAGAKIFTNSTVAKLEEDKQPVKIKTADGKTVTATHLIVTTNAPINDNAAIFSKQAPYRTYVVGFQIKKDAIPPALFWDTMDPFHYVRTSSYDKTHDVLIVGGEDHKAGQADDMEERYKHLEAWSKKRFPEAEKVLFRWSGQVFITVDGLAMIGKKPGGEAWSFIATGDCGMGMTHGTIAGLLLADLATGTNHPWEETYDPSRMRLKSTTEFMKENANVAIHAVKDWVKGSEESKPIDIKPGSGAVMRDGTKKIALYRDDNGNFHACSAVCPHKGCIVQWNDGEKSWDCPCHGSRYEAKGEVLTGPTRGRLEALPDWKAE
jgi:glycine/D-amino acid oxidase-like deaminating enzyme/nitrite reductase/ring-hydroxylating ferredoxin subunit